MSFPEVQRLLHLMNVEMEPEYAFQLFQVSLLGKEWQKPAKAPVSLDQSHLTRSTMTLPDNTHLLDLYDMLEHYARLDGKCRPWFFFFF